MRTLAGGLLLPMVLLSASCGSGDKEGGAQPPKQALAVAAYRVSEQPFNNTVTVTAQLQANEQVQLMAPMSAQVLEILFNEGETVREGQPIIRMDDRSWKAQLVGLRAELDATSKDLERKRALLAMEGSTQEEVDMLGSKMETLGSQIRQLEINIELANVVAPFSGTLGLRNFSKGAYLREGEVITVITQMDRLKVDFSLPQQHRESVKVGKAVKVLVANDTLEAKVYAVSPVVDVTSRTVNVRAMLDQRSGEQIMPGTFAEVLVGTNFIENALLVPTQAIVPEINDQTVFICRNGKAERKTVKIGNRSSQLVHVTEGLSAGDTIIITGLLQVKPGMDIILQSVDQ